VVGLGAITVIMFTSDGARPKGSTRHSTMSHLGRVGYGGVGNGLWWASVYVYE
jgi:hypothetical protein